MRSELTGRVSAKGIVAQIRQSQRREPARARSKYLNPFCCCRTPPESMFSSTQNRPCRLPDRPTRRHLAIAVDRIESPSDWTYEERMIGQNEQDQQLISVTFLSLLPSYLLKSTPGGDRGLDSLGASIGY